MMRWMIVCAMVLTFAGIRAQSETVFFISTFGDDLNPGT